MKKKIIIVAVVILAIAIAGFAFYWEASHGNRRLIDTKNRFDRAIIRLPNGESVEGKVSSWLDYNDSDVVMISLDCKTYMTHYSNVALIDD